MVTMTDARVERAFWFGLLIGVLSSWLVLR